MNTDDEHPRVGEEFEGLSVSVKFVIREDRDRLNGLSLRGGREDCNAGAE